MSDDDADWIARYEPDTLPPPSIESASAADDILPIDDQVAHAETQHSSPQRAVLGDTCAICLHALDDPVLLPRCHHVFCLACLSSWARNLTLHGVREPTCPLCKRVFHAAYADVVSETDYRVVHFDGRAGRRATAGADGALRRSMVYTQHMRLVRINGVAVSATDALPMPVKFLAHEVNAWLEQELRACVGPLVDLTVLRALIESVLGSPVQRHVEWRALEDTLAPFLLDDTALFVRELAYFLASRLNLHAYDHAVEYCCAGDASTPCTVASCAATHGSD